jgi:hypothetical protein
VSLGVLVHQVVVEAEPGEFLTEKGWVSDQPHPPIVPEGPAVGDPDSSDAHAVAAGDIGGVDHPDWSVPAFSDNRIRLPTG